MKLQGIPLLFGALLALAVTAVMLSLTLVFRTEDFPSIHYACSINGLSPTECLSRAQGVGLQCLIAFTIVLALAIWRSWFFQNEIVEKQTPQTPLMLFLTFALGLFSLHVGILVFGPAFVSRLNETESYGDFISLENLLLPLLLQFFVATPKDSPARFPLLAALLMGMALSPYRAMLLALFCFGLLLPWLLEGWRVWCGKPGHESPKILGYQAVWVLLIGVALLVAGLQDTKMRSPTLLAHSLGLADLPPEHPLSPEVLNGITQRKMAQGVVVKGADQTSAVKPTGEMLPASAEEMLAISGIGEQKIQRYGEIFLNLIAQHAMASDRSSP